MKLLVAVVVCIGWIFSGVLRAQEVSVIPYPASVRMLDGKFSLKAGKIGYRTAEFAPEAGFLAEQLEDLSCRMKADKDEKKAVILLTQSADIQNREGYRLQITPKGVTIAAKNRAGMFYGIQTFLQLVRNGGRDLACCEIEDAPRYDWRGYMLDESRHFFGKEKVKQLLDWMAYYKLNKFHWHLTDEPGWRIEIKKYPRLATVGGKGNWSDPNCQDVRFYTQDEIREIVAYAAGRHIEIIPEIDMPGHATAANFAYPGLSGGGTPEHPEFTFNVGKEKVYQFLTDVLREVTGLFPSSLIHTGGDEVAYGIKAWETDADVQGMMKREGLTEVKEAERYFTHRIADSVRMLGKTLAGWDELLDAGVPVGGTLIFWWRHDRVNQLKKLLAKGYETVLCPRKPLYFDFIQHKTHKWGRVWSGFCRLEDVYAFPDKGIAAWGIPAEHLMHIRGIQANVWTERMHNTRRLDFMTFPRICALAESAWTPAGVKDYDSFTRRMEKAYRDFDRAGIYYFDARDPEARPEPAGPQQQKRNLPMDFRD